MVCFRRQKSDYVKGIKRLKFRLNEMNNGYLLPDGGPDDLPLLVLFAILLPPLPLRLLDGFLPEQQNNLRAIQGS